MPGQNSPVPPALLTTQSPAVPQTSDPVREIALASVPHIVLPAPRSAECTFDDPRQCGVLQAISRIGGTPTAIGLERVYRAGELLKIDFTGPDFPAWIQIDYWDRAGNVLHLMPSPSARENVLQPLETVRVGGPDGRGRVITVGPPFGQDLVTIIAVSKPLWTSLRPEIERADDYLAALGGALRQARAVKPRLDEQYAAIAVLSME
jgi:hypothetical protein